MPAGDKFNISGPVKKVLVAPLDWGLGHATRCVPIIRELIQLNCEVIIAAEKSTEILLKKEFPELQFIQLKGYRIHYSASAKGFATSILLQLPKIVTAVFSENRWLKKVVKQYSIDAVISDNRPGLYHDTIPSIYITHQLQIKTGKAITDRWAQKIHHHFIKKFKACWVPDFEGPINLAGALSHPSKKIANANYIGGLSRFEKSNDAIKSTGLLVLLSGPEPQRTILENILLQQLNLFDGKVFLVRGLPGNDDQLKNHNQRLTIVNHLSAEELNTAICNAELIVCRSGYTTVMDLIKLKKRAILIPTPGQTEQEYLAVYLQEQQLFYSTTQREFNLQQSLNEEKKFKYSHRDFDMNQYQTHVENFVQSI